MIDSPSPWSPSERAAWAPPEDITVSEWATKHRVLPKSSAFPGGWNSLLGAYTVGVMDAFNDPWVERITIMASVQSMKTESVYNMLGWAICQDPAPALIVMPTLNTMKRVNHRIRKMFWASPELSLHLTTNVDDVQLHQIILDRMEIYFATAGSEADLQNIEARYIICDETDEYPQEGGGGSPVEMAIDRSTTYWNRKVVELSRPTTPDGHIYKSYEKSDRRKFWVPCPHCGGYQVLSFWQVKHKGETRGAWPESLRHPEYIKRERVARYECEHCAAEIDDQHKPEMLARGKWVPEGHPIAFDGAMEPLPPAAHVGFWWSALYSPFRSFSEVAAQFFKVRGDREQNRVFVTQWLAEPWKEIIRRWEGAAIMGLRTERLPRLCPPGTLALTAGIDSHKNGYWVAIFAWRMNPDPESHLIRYGFLPNFDDLETWIFSDLYPVENSSATLPVWFAAIDTGGGSKGPWERSITDKVYDWLYRRGRGRVFGVKGSSHALPYGLKMRQAVQPKLPTGKPIPGGLPVWFLDTATLKDDLWARIEAKCFHLHAHTDEIFGSHLTAEVKERDLRGKETWVLQASRSNHLLDCTIYAAALADTQWLGRIMGLSRKEQPPASESTRGSSGWINRFTGKPRGDFFKR